MPLPRSTNYPYHYKMLVTGNLNDRIGNPVPYKRVLGGAKKRKGDIDYLEWKEFLVGVFFDATRAFAPIATGKDRVEAIVRVVWKDEKHGDLDNVVKGVLDALLVNDKYVDNITASSCYGDVGSVWIELIIRPRERGV